MASDYVNVAVKTPSAVPLSQLPESWLLKCTASGAQARYMTLFTTAMNNMLPEKKTVLVRETETKTKPFYKELFIEKKNVV